MNKPDNKRYQMLTRVREFGSRHASDFPADAFGGRIFAEVGAVITALAGYATAQSVGRGGARERTVSKATARAALYEHLLAINVTARALALDTPGLETKCRMPRSGTDEVLITAGRAFAADAVPLAGAFQQRDMPGKLHRRIERRHCGIGGSDQRPGSPQGRARGGDGVLGDDRGSRHQGGATAECDGAEQVSRRSGSAGGVGEAQPCRTSLVDWSASTARASATVYAFAVEAAASRRRKASRRGGRRA